MTQATAPSGPRLVSVLIIEDDVDIRDAVREILEDEGYSVALAGHGAEALEVLKTIRPSVILLDLNMPVMNGLQFRRLQQRDPELRNIPTVVMTAIDRMKDHLADVAPDDAIAKPIKLSTLLAVVGASHR